MNKLLLLCINLQRSVVLILILFFSFSDANANWWDFIEDTYGDYDIEINYYENEYDYMHNDPDGYDNYYDNISSITYEDSYDSNYA
ncbi:MAG TPA: hypothetical protein VJ855_02235 [Marinilabiliaceae bacterium]|nr:hypothetical protein [Marinilabiliaceae bacterium]